MRFIGLAVLLCAVPAVAQLTTGSISGFVLDPSERGIPSASIVVSDRFHTVTHRTSADSLGFFRVPDLPALEYEIEASAAGFSSASASVRVAVNSPLRIDFHLPIAGHQESTTVEVRVRPLQTETSDLGQSLDRSTIERLPLNQRDFLRLALLTPGVAPPVQGSQLSARGGFAMNVNGGREEFNNFLLDGVDNNDPENNRYNLQPPVDAIQEFKIATNSYSAEYGRNAAGQVNVVTRGGTNDWHGFGYEYLRNRVLDARNFFDSSEKPQYLRNQFGGGFGGPLRKDRMFIFADADALRERAGQSRLASVPNATERAGDLSGIAAMVLDPFTRSPFTGNKIPASRISPIARDILDLFPLPNLSGSALNYLAQPVLRNAYTQFNIRLDHRFSDHDQLTLRDSYGRRNLYEPFGQGATNIPGFGDFVDDAGHNAMLQEVHAFGSPTINTVLLGVNLGTRRVLPENHATNVNQKWGVGYLPNNPIDFGYPSIRIAGLSTVGDVTSIPIDRAVETYQLIDTVSFSRGAHQIKAGGEVRNVRLNGTLNQLTRGSLSFSGALSNSGIGDLLLGFPSFAIQSQSDNRQHQRTTAYNTFVQDDWKVTRNLTLNFGLRYEYNTPATDPSDRMSVFDLSRKQLMQVGSSGVSRSGVRSNPDNLAPRLGFAWAVTDKAVLRGGYGLFYDDGMLVVNSALYFNPPYFSVRTFIPTATSLLTLNNPFATNSSVTPPASLTTLAPDLTTAYMQDWNFDVQREVWRGGTFSVAYAGSKGTHLIRSLNLNQPLPGPGALAPRRPYFAFGNISLIESGGNSSYHSLQGSYRHLLGGSLTLLALYTYSKSIDDTSAFLGDNAETNYPQDSRSYNLERARSGFDMRHQASVAWVYALPDPRIWARNMEFRGIFVAQSGQPFTPILRFDNSNTGNSGSPYGSDRPNVIGAPQLAHPSANEWFNTAAFAIPPRFTFGNAGRNSLTGPGMFTVDLSVAKRFALLEHVFLIAEAQAFNVLNHTNFNLPQAFADEPVTFGHILSANAPKQIQLALRLTF